MEYLNRVLGIRVNYLTDTADSMPNYIHERYRLVRVALNGKRAVFVYPKSELEPVDKVKKHTERICREEDAPAVLVLERLSRRQKEYLLRDHIPFIVDGKQIYLPFMAVYLQERCDREKNDIKPLLPSAQVLLLFYIYNGCGELMTSRAAEELGFTPTSISRASKQLEEYGLISLEKRGVQKVICTGRSPEELFDSAKGIISSPVKRILYVPKAEIKDDLRLSGYSALSEYAMINSPAVITLASDKVNTMEKYATIRLQDSEDQCALELWRYDPGILSDGICVDRLSLALSLSEEKDERVEESVDEMLRQVWRDIDGKRS